MEKPDWDSINRMVHIQLGKLRWENSERHRKRKRKFDSFAEEASTMSEMEDTVDSVVLGDNLLPVDWDKELMERLRPAKKRANHKRAASQNDLELTFTQHQFTNIAYNGQQEPHREQRAQSEDPSIEACARQRRRRYQNNRAHLIVEHDESEMSRRSPGDRKRRQTSSKGDVVDLSNDSKPPLALPEEGEDFEDSLESEGVPRVLSARRIPPNSGRDFEEIRSAPKLSHPAKSVSSGNASTLNSGSLIHGGEETNASTQDNVRDQKDSDESRVATKEPWSYFKHYHNRPPSSIRDYGNPSAAAPVPVPTLSPKEEQMPVPKGGVQPVNRLGNHASNQNPNPPYRKPIITKDKFHQYEDKSRANDTYPNKRQKIEGTTISHNGSSRSPISLEDEPVEQRKRTETPTTKSAKSQTRNGHRFRVEEYHNVEEMMRGHPRKSSSSDSQMSTGRGGKQFLNNGLAKGASVLSSDTHDMEDKDDPIVDVEVLDSNTTHKTTPQVLIESHQYQGSAFRKPPRPQPNVERGRNPSTFASSTHEVSPHFPGPQIRAQKHNSNGSHSADDTAPARNSARLLSRQNGTSNTARALLRDATPLSDADIDLDEISAEHYETAQSLRMTQKMLAGQKTPKESSNKTIEENRRQQSLRSDESTDDESVRRAADIIPTKFTSLKGAGGKIVPNGERYDAMLVFSETNKWLVESSKGPWPLVHDPKSKTMRLLDGDNGSMWTLPTTKVKKIEYNSRSMRLVIHKDRDYTAGSATHVYIQLRDADQSNGLLKSLKESQPTMQKMRKDEEYLRKVLDNNLAKLLSNRTRLEPKKSGGSIEEEEPLDIQLANKRMESKWDSRRDSMRSATQLDGKGTGEDETNERPKSLAGSMRTRSSSGHLEDVELQQPFKVPEVLSGDFYGTSNSRRTNLGSAHETRSSTRGLERTQRPRQQRQQRPRSPSPLGWTTLNPEWAKEWHGTVIYPAEGNSKARVDKATVEMEDIKKLDEGEFLNDNLIWFYLRWLQNRLEQEHPDWAKRIFIQNTFFYARLTSPEKGKKGINYAAVERWTARINLLDYDYIIIPVNEHLHWYVAIICNASKLLAGAEATDHSQSQGDTEALEDQPIDPEETTKTVPVSAASPKHLSEVANDAKVDVVMKDMSLDEKRPYDTGESEWPDDNLDPATMPRGMPSIPHDDPRRENDAAETGSPEPANVTSDLPVPTTLKTSQTKRSKRKSIPTPRKYNPKEFRIITLDSLGTSHTNACTNLKDYLVQEIKAKLDIDIPRPGSVGTTAKNIPRQNNYSDCGLFLLSYIEMFFKNPDEFVSGILQHELDVDMPWPNVSKMRAHIRDILLDLQTEQVTETERLGKGKGKGKKVLKTEGKIESAPSTKSSSREASKSARASPDGRNLNVSRATEEKTIRLQVESSRTTESSESRESALEKQPASPEPCKSNGENLEVLPERDDMRKPDALPTREVHDLNADSQNSSKVFGIRFNDIVSNVTTKVSGYFNNDKSRITTASKPTLSGPDVIEIQDSPQKVDSAKVPPSLRDPEMQDSSRTLVEYGNDVLENRRSSVEYVGNRGISKSRHQHNAKNFRESPATDIHDLASPTPDATEPSYRTPGRHNVHDLRSPSPEDVELLHHGQASRRLPSHEGAVAYPHIAEDRERATQALSPDVVQTLGPNVRDHQLTSYQANRLGDPSDGVEDEFKGFENEIYDSVDEDEEVDIINAEQPGPTDTLKGATEASASDAEMLLLSKSSGGETIEIMSDEEAAAEDVDPSLLSDSSVSASETMSASKKYREGGKPSLLSAAHPHKDTIRKATTSPSRGRKRKAIGESEDWQHHARPNPVMRDSSDHAIIGRYAQGKHTKFNE